MRNEFMLAINQVCSERQLAKEVVLEAVETALITAYKRNFGTAGTITASIDAETGTTHIFAEKEVCEQVLDSRTEISLEDAQRLNPEIKLGDTLMVESTPKDFGRIAAQTAKQVILQRIREAERDALYSVYAEREGEIVNGTVQSIDSQVVIVNLGKAEGTLPRSEQIPTERYRLNQRLRAYVMEVERGTRGPRIILSRNHRNMLRRLLELEVPEIFNGAVEIKAIAREPGSRSKVAVTALRPGVDPVGSCVGMRGTRIQGIVNELNGEKIDVIEWNADLPDFISHALSPAQVINVRLDDGADGKTATVIVPDKQLSLAIGKEGQNARLAAKLTGWRIDIKSATEAAEEVFAAAERATRPVAHPEEDLLSRAAAILASLPPTADLGAGQSEEIALQAGFEEVPAEALEPAAGVTVAETAFVETEAQVAPAASEAAGAELVTDVATVTQPPEEEAEEEEGYEEGAEEELEEGEAASEYAEEEVESVVAVAEGEGEDEELEPLSEETAELVEEYLEAGDEEEQGKKKKDKDWRLKHVMVFDEAAGRVVTKRKRKPSRQRGEWGSEDD